MNKKLLLTGIAGSIGIHTLSQIMKNTDWDVVGIDSFRHKGWCDRVAHHLKDHPQDVSRITVITHDLTAPFSDLTKRKIGHVDYIINMASLSDVEASIQEPVPFVQNNVALVLNMLEFARETKPESFIQISTDETVGPTLKGQRHEEWASIIPSNPYSASKACQEAIAISYWRTYGVPVVITNTVNNFAEMQSSSKFPVIVQKKLMKNEVVTIHGNEKHIGSRFYIHSQNFANALVFILKNLTPYLHKDGEVDKPDRYNITSDDEINNLEFAQIIAEAMGKELKYDFVDVHATRPGHDRFYGLSGEKLKKLGWTPPVSFKESLKNVIEWQANNPQWLE